MSIESALAKGPYTFKWDTICWEKLTPIKREEIGFRDGKEHYSVEAAKEFKAQHGHGQKASA